LIRMRGPIRRGRLTEPAEFGYKAALQEVESGADRVLRVAGWPGGGYRAVQTGGGAPGSSRRGALLFACPAGPREHCGGRGRHGSPAVPAGKLSLVYS
jgi:hypothetical protein